MNFRSFVLIVGFLSSFSLFAQNKLSELNNILNNRQESKPQSGTQSNLAVSDQGKEGSKSTSKTANSSPIDKLKKQDSKDDSPSGSSNLAVSDEGTVGTKGGGKKSSSREMSGSDSTKTGEMKKPETKTDQPK